MDRTLSLLKQGIVLAICAVVVAAAWGSTGNYGGLYKLLVQARFGFLALLLLVVAFVDWRDFRASGSRGAFRPTVIVLAGMIVTTIIVLWDHRRASVPVIVHAAQFKDFNGSSLDLRVDGTYRYCDIVFWEDCCYGTYTIEGDGIRLVSDDACKAGRLLIGTCSDGSTRKCLIWKDDMEASPEMWLHEDRRKAPPSL